VTAASTGRGTAGSSARPERAVTRAALILDRSYTPGAYGTPRPYLVVQSDLFNGTHDSVTIAPLTSTLVSAPLFRITLEALALATSRHVQIIVA